RGKWVLGKRRARDLDAVFTELDAHREAEIRSPCAFFSLLITNRPMKHIPFSRASRLLSVALLLAPSLHAAIKLLALVGDNMVLQSEAKANVWGWADPGEKVTVTFEGKTQKASAGADGRRHARRDD